MSKRQMEVLVDDIDGTAIVDETQGRTVPVKIGDLIDTELDLTNENIERLENLFREFVGTGESNTKPFSRNGSRASVSNTEDLAVIREWARKNGHKINARGRIPFSVMDAFTKAHVGKMRS